MLHQDPKPGSEREDQAMSDTPSQPPALHHGPGALQSPGLITFDPAVQFNRSYPPCYRTAIRYYSLDMI